MGGQNKQKSIFGLLHPPLAVVAAIVDISAPDDTGEDEEDASTDGGEDGHDEGGHHQTLVLVPGPTDGEDARGEEDDGSPDASAQEVPCEAGRGDFGGEDDDTTEDVDPSKQGGLLGLVDLIDGLAR